MMVSGLIRFLTSRAGRFHRSVSGNIAIMTAMSMPVVIVLAAIAIDEASLYTEKRETQALADLAAITAAANLAKAETAVVATLGDNGLSGVAIARSSDAGVVTDGPSVTVTPGRYIASPATEVGARFQAGAQPHNAVKVTLRRLGTRYFAASLIEPPVISAQGVASLSAQAAFSIGSRLASVHDGILNGVLGGLVGGNLSLKVMDYDALIKADVELFDFLDALATRLSLTGGPYEDVLDASATIGQIAAAMASVPGIDPQARLAIQTIANQAGSEARIPLSKLFDLGSTGALAIGSHPTGLTARTSIMDMLTAGAALANGDRQVEVDLGASVPGLLTTKLTLAIGEPPQSSPWFALGESGTVIRTAQTRLFLEVSLGLKVLPVLDILELRLPIYAEVAYAEAKLTNITCRAGKPTVSVAARPGIFDLRIADITSSTFRNTPLPNGRAEIARLPAVRVTAQVAVTSSNLAYRNLEFSASDIDARAVKTVSTQNITQSLIGSLIGKPGALKVEVLGLDLLGLGNILLPALKVALEPVSATVDTLLYNVLTALGIHLGEADVQVNGASCGHSVLVQ